MTRHVPEIDTTLPHFRESGARQTFIECLWCKKPLAFEAGKGWTHAGGGLYESYCIACQWRGAPASGTPRFCPNCGSRKVLDHHVATPRRS